MEFCPRQCALARQDFPALARIYRGLPVAFLDGPAGTQVPRSVLAAMEDYYTTSNSNTHGVFLTARETDEVLVDCRSAVAAFLGATDWRTISFGQNMTTLAYSLGRGLVRTMKEGDEVLITALDHEANRGPWLALREHGIRVKEIALRPGGGLDYEDLAVKLGPRTQLLAMGYASNALGTVNDVQRARELARRHDCWFLVDAVHQAAHFPIDVGDLDPDFLLCSAYKFYGPHVGILYSRPGLLDEIPTDHLRIQASEAPYRIETGTLNHAALVGVRAAVQYLASWGEGKGLRDRVVSAMTAIAGYEHDLAQHYHARVSRLPGARVLGPGFDAGPRCPTVTVEFEGRSAQELASRLAERALQVWHGDYGAIRPLELLGVAERGGAIRTGIVMYNTREEVDRVLEALSDLL